MRIATNRRASYSIRAVIDLARHYEGGGRRKARELSESVGIPRQYVAQVLGPLVRARIVDGLAGPDGGYRLSHSPSDVTLLEVVEAAQGWTAPEECLLRDGLCNEADPCELHAFRVAARDTLMAQLHEVTFSELAQGRLEGSR